MREAQNGSALVHGASVMGAGPDRTAKYRVTDLDGEGMPKCMGQERHREGDYQEIRN